MEEKCKFQVNKWRKAMKALEHIITQKPVYLHNWNEKIDVIRDFEGVYATENGYSLDKVLYPNKEWVYKNKKAMTEAIRKYDGIHILFATYGQVNCYGDTWVLFEQNNKLYEVNGSHCSCCELEDQWQPEELILEELENRVANGTLGENDWSENEFKNELENFLGIGY